MVPLVRSDVTHRVATITLDSPTNRNALSSGLIEQLLAALRAAERDDAVRVVVLSHTGPVFCSGVDLKETAAAFAAGPAGSAGAAGRAGPVAPAGRLGEVLVAIWESRKPVVARVAGPARAGGLGLIAAADIAVCVTDATFAFSEVRLGVIPAVISATVLPRLTPRAAAELYLTGETFDGTRAAEIGLVTTAVAAGELDDTVARLVAALIRGAPAAIAGAKSLSHRDRPDISAEIDALTRLSVEYFGSPEGLEGVRAFRARSTPSWVPEARCDPAS
jgi:methylglutaconyl-CoA hydratase